MITFGYLINADKRPDDEPYERDPDSSDGVRRIGDLTRIRVRR